MTRIAKRLLNSAGLENITKAAKSEPIEPSALLAAVSVAEKPHKKVAPGRGRKSRYTKEILAAVEVLANKGFNIQEAATTLRNNGLDFVRAPSLRFAAIRAGIPFKSLKGPRKPKVAAETPVVKVEVPAHPVSEKVHAPKAFEPVTLASHRRGRRSAHVKGLILALQNAGFSVK